MTNQPCTILIDVAQLATWLKDHGTDNMKGNAILDGLEDLYNLETELAKQFPKEANNA